MKRAMIFIDGNNFYFGLKRLFGSERSLTSFNFERFCATLSQQYALKHVYYYNAPLNRTQNPEKYKSQQRFFARLRTIPHFTLVLCSLLRRRVPGKNTYYYVLKEDDIHMAVDLLRGAYDDQYDTALLVSGDGDFVPAVLAAQEKGKEIINVSFKKSASTNLKRHSNHTLTLDEAYLEQFFDD